MDWIVVVPSRWFGEALNAGRDTSDSFCLFLVIGRDALGLLSEALQ